MEVQVTRLRVPNAATVPSGSNISTIETSPFCFNSSIPLVLQSLFLIQNDLAKIYSYLEVLMDRLTKFLVYRALPEAIPSLWKNTSKSLPDPNLLILLGIKLKII